MQSDTSLHFHIPTLRAQSLSSNEMWYQERVSVHITLSRSSQRTLGVSYDPRQSSPVPASLNECAHGGYAGVRLAEARNLGQATDERDRTAEERTAPQSRINEAGDPVPGSQDALTRRVQNLQLSDSPATPANSPRPQTYRDKAATRIPSRCSM